MEDADPEGDEDDSGDLGDAPSPFEAGSPLAGHWAALLADATATADVYRGEGWEVLELHPTEASVRTDPDAFGLEVRVPDDEFERLSSWVAAGRFDEYEVYRAETGRVFLLVVASDEANRRVVCVPAHYGFESASALAERAGSEERFHTRVRRDDGERVTFTHDDPDPFFPGGGPDPASDEGGGGTVAGTDTNGADADGRDDQDDRDDR